MNVERIKGTEFLTTFNIVRELDFCDPHTFPLLFAFKLEDIQENNRLCDEVIKDFKTGKADPSTLIWQ